MPSPKDPLKLSEYKEKQRQIALERGYGKWMLGRKIPRESVEKTRSKNKIGHNTAEWKAKMSSIAKANGFGKWMAGRKGSSKQVLSCHNRRGKTYEQLYGERAELEAVKRRVGNRVRWLGRPRKSDLRPHQGNTWEYQTWRRSVFERDDFTCRHCLKRGGTLNAHHIRPWAKFPDLRFDLSNGVTLCAQCHKAEHRRLKTESK